MNIKESVKNRNKLDLSEESSKLNQEDENIRSLNELNEEMEEKETKFTRKR